MPGIHAAIELNENRPAQALADLTQAQSYELGSISLAANGNMYPVYLRGQAYLKMRNGAQAAAQFQTFFDHRGVALNSMLAALARLGLARSHMLQGDTSKVRTAYEDFLILWRDADLDVPIYEQAKAEYRKLQ